MVYNWSFPIISLLKAFHLYGVKKKKKKSFLIKLLKWSFLIWRAMVLTSLEQEAPTAVLVEASTSVALGASAFVASEAQINRQANRDERERERVIMIIAIIIFISFLPWIFIYSVFTISKIYNKAYLHIYA